MNAIIDAAFSRNRVVTIVLVLILLTGVLAYSRISKEAAPDVPIPIIYVSVVHEGISPEDAERLLVRPLERELQSIEGVDEMSAVAAEGFASVMLEFDAGFDPDQAELDVRQAVDTARTDLPEGAEEPVVEEINVALFPILTVALSGPVAERALIDMAEDLQDRIEALPDVLSADIGGAREDLLEVLVDPSTLNAYGIPFEQLLGQIERNNQLIAAGSIDTGAGKLALKVPGSIEEIDDVSAIPLKVSGNAVVTLGDVALVRKSFKDPTGFARIDGQPAVSLEVRKRTGANIIETVEAVKAVLEEARPMLPESVSVTYLQDQSTDVEETLTDLQNNVVAAVLLVMMVTVALLGWRNSLLVGLAIPGSFFAGIAIIWWMGYTLNIIVLFSLILVLGMLIDSAVVTTEYADRRMAGGAAPADAYREAAKRMSRPITASTIMTLCVFFPLLFWGGVVGEFMKFLPITVIVVMIASLAMGLIFIPVLGSLIGRRNPRSEAANKALSAAETGDLDDLDSFTARYVALLRRLVARPGITLLAAVAFLVAAIVAYVVFGRGVEFFPEIEPRFVQITVTARDNLSVYEKDELVRRVGDLMIEIDGVDHVYSRTIDETAGEEGQQQQLAADAIGAIQLDLLEWDERRKADEIIAEVRQKTAGIAGIRITATEQETGPEEGKPIELRLFGEDSEALEQAVAQVRTVMADLGGFTDIEDTTNVAGVEWRIEIDHEKAARFGVDTASLGQAVQLLTRGLPLAEYRPADSDEPVDIVVRFPSRERTLDGLERLTVSSELGQMPISNFVTIEPVEKIGVLRRIDGQQVVTVESDVAEGELPAEKTQQLQTALDEAQLPQGVQASFVGQQKDIEEASNFLILAFTSAIVLMFLVLATQLNNIYQALVVMSAIVFSITGVLIGLLVTGRPFGIVMGGIGIISLGGIVVNNNIVLIDTYQEMRRKGHDVEEAAIRTAAQRLRAVFLTSINDVLGLMPLILGLNINLIGREIQYGAPSTQYWTELSTTVAGGLAFATFLTLLLTPCMLVLAPRLRERFTKGWNGIRERANRFFPKNPATKGS